MAVTAQANQKNTYYSRPSIERQQTKSNIIRRLKDINVVIKRQQTQANIIWNLEDLDEDQIRVRKAVETLVIGYLPGTSDTRHREAINYFCQLLRQLVYAMSKTIKQKQTPLVERC